jgi:hypothetical protein
MRVLARYAKPEPVRYWASLLPVPRVPLSPSVEGSTLKGAR